MEYQKLIRTRRSIRGYRPDPVSEDILQKILDAARIAPTAANRQPFQLIVVTDPSTRARLKEVYDRDWFWTAPVIIVGCVEEAKAWQRADGFNAAAVERFSQLEGAEVAAAFERTRLVLLNLVGTMPDEILSKPNVQSWLRADVIDHYYEHRL